MRFLRIPTWQCGSQRPCYWVRSTKRKAQGRASRGADKVQRSRDADADLFEADAGQAANSESESFHCVGNTEFEADACRAGINVVDEGDDSQGDDGRDACDSDVAQHGVDEEC